MFSTSKMRKYMKQQRHLAELVVLISKTLQLPEEDDKVQELAEAIFVKYHGPFVRMGP
jgi:hypothetical protein